MEMRAHMLVFTTAEPRPLHRIHIYSVLAARSVLDSDINELFELVVRELQNNE